MDQTTPARMNPRNNTSDLLTWSEAPSSHSSSAISTNNNNNKASDGIGKVVFGGHITDEEAESLNKRKPCSGYKLKEMSGSKIFAEGAEDETLEAGNSNGNNRTSVRIVQQVTNGISQISFGTDDKVSPKKPTTVPEVAKQRELSGTLERESENGIKKSLSDAKSKELSGNDIFGPPPEIRPTLAAARTMETKESKDFAEPHAPRSFRTSVKVSNPAGGQSNILFGDEPVVNAPKKIHDQKFAELTGTDIFKGEVPHAGSAEKPLSVAKLKEMSGNDIFADGKIQSRDYFGGVRKPPGGESTISLV